MHISKTERFRQKKGASGRVSQTQKIAVSAGRVSLAQKIAGRLFSGFTYDRDCVSRTTDFIPDLQYNSEADRKFFPKFMRWRIVVSMSNCKRVNGTL